MIQLSIEKSKKMPIVWLDTSIINNLTQLRLGHTLDKVSEKRIKNLKKRMVPLLHRQKLLCPLANQDEEIWRYRKEWLKTMEEFSFGISTNTLLQIKKIQFKQFVKAFLNENEKIIISYRDAFYKDPVEELLHSPQQGFRVIVHPPLIGTPEQNKYNHDLLFSKLEEQRTFNIKHNVSYNEQLEAEFLSDLEARSICIREFQRHPDPIELSDNILSFLLYFGILYNIWEIEKSKVPGNKSTLFDFYQSEYNKEMPFTSLEAHFHARLSTQSNPIRPGDAKDINHIATMLPYCDLFITDKQRKRETIKKRFDKKYNTTVAYIGDTNLIKNFFDNIS